MRPWYGRRVEVRHEGLERARLVAPGRRDVLDDRLEQRHEVGPLDPLLGRGPAVTRRGIQGREVDLIVGCVEVHEQLEHRVDDLGDPGVVAVHLVDDQDHGQALLERLAKDEASLRKRPFGCVHEEQDSVDHRQAALHLAAEVGVARRVDDVYLDLAPVLGRVAEGSVLGEDRDPALALLVARVHHPLHELLVCGEGARLAQHGVDQGRLAVVDVGDDRDVPELEHRR